MTKLTEKDNEQNTKETGQALAQVETQKVPAINAKRGQHQEGHISTESQAEDIEVPTNDNRYVKFGIIFLFLTLGVFTIWGATAPLSSALVSQGKVVVDSYRKTIQHFEGGIVEQIFVKNGDIVKQGDPLIQLENAQFKAGLENSYKRLMITKAELERLNAEQDFKESVTFSEELISCSRSRS